MSKNYKAFLRHNDIGLLLWVQLLFMVKDINKINRYKNEKNKEELSCTNNSKRVNFKPSHILESSPHNILAKYTPKENLRKKIYQFSIVQTPAIWSTSQIFISLF